MAKKNGQAVQSYTSFCPPLSSLCVVCTFTAALFQEDTDEIAPVAENKVDEVKKRRRRTLKPCVSSVLKVELSQLKREREREGKRDEADLAQTFRSAVESFSACFDCSF